MTAEPHSRVIGFIGLGKMGQPMVRRLLQNQWIVRGYDTSTDSVSALEGSEGFSAINTLTQVPTGAGIVIMMLPDSEVVEEVLLNQGLLNHMAAGTLLIDMSSSDPVRTQLMAERAKQHKVVLIDAPVSGGVSGAEKGALTIMVGGPEDAFADAESVLLSMGSRVLHAGPVGAGDAVKALNNLMSATHLLVTSEAMIAAQRFGLDPAVVLEIVNGSSGRSGSTENKWPNFVIPGTYNSGFGLRLMLKDMRIAIGLAEEVDSPMALGAIATELWADAAASLPATADHTEVARWLQSTEAQSDSLPN